MAKPVSKYAESVLNFFFSLTNRQKEELKAFSNQVVHASCVSSDDNLDLRNCHRSSDEDDSSLCSECAQHREEMLKLGGFCLGLLKGNQRVLFGKMCLEYAFLNQILPDEPGQLERTFEAEESKIESKLDDDLLYVYSDLTDFMMVHENVKVLGTALAGCIDRPKGSEITFEDIVSFMALYFPGFFSGAYSMDAVRLSRSDYKIKEELKDYPEVFTKFVLKMKKSLYEYEGDDVPDWVEEFCSSMRQGKVPKIFRAEDEEGREAISSEDQLLERAKAAAHVHDVFGLQEIVGIVRGKKGFKRLKRYLKSKMTTEWFKDKAETDFLDQIEEGS
jgi:hypothetical protein